MRGESSDDVLQYKHFAPIKHCSFLVAVLWWILGCHRYKLLWHMETALWYVLQNTITSSSELATGHGEAECRFLIALQVGRDRLFCFPFCRIGILV
jgi:hypothetical protein